MYESGVFPIFLERDLSKVKKILVFCQFTVSSLIFCSMQLFTIPVCSRRRRRFVNSAFPNKKHLAQKTKFIHDKQKLKPMFAEILRTKNATGKRRLTSSNRAAMSRLHAH